MPAQRIDLITVALRKDESGWFFATSEDCPGLFVSDPDKDRVVRLLPQAIELLYEARLHLQVKAVPLTQPASLPERESGSLPFATIPVQMLARPGTS